MTTNETPEAEPDYFEAFAANVAPAPVIEPAAAPPVAPAKEPLANGFRALPPKLKERNPRGWILLASGRQFWPLEPRTDEIFIEDIAHGLAQMSRFGGQVPQGPYTVAEHSIRVSEWAERKAPNKKGVAKKIALMGLLHDASEGLGLGDMVRPVKVELTKYGEAEARLQNAVWQRFGITPEDIAEHYPLVKDMDEAMLATERMQLFKGAEPGFSLFKLRSTVEPLPQRIKFMVFAVAKKRFLDRFRLIGRMT